MTTSMAVFDDLAAGLGDDALRSWVATGTALGDDPVRCPVTESDPVARQRLDLALRVLHGQPVTSWCRSAGEGAAVVRRWPLPARAVALHDGRGEVTTFVLAVGRPGGHADVWRFRPDAVTGAVLDRGLDLLAT